MSSETGDVIIEYFKIGRSVRVTAVDADSGLEVVYQAPVSASRAEMEKTALRKLKYVMRKKKTAKDTNATSK